MNSNLGCVLAIRDRPPEYLGRTLQTFTYQTLQPLDKVLVDYGSAPDVSAEYERLCSHHGWRFLRQEPASPRWCPAAAYNIAVHALPEGVDIVFKSDIDVLLGPDVLRLAALKGREKLCAFACRTTAAGSLYPPRLESYADLAGLLRAPDPPVPMPRQAVHAFPRRWFTAIGGYDLDLDGRGNEDADLRARAGQSIGLVEETSALLIHQWHPFPERFHNVHDRDYHQRQVAGRGLVRNGGILLPAALPASEAAPTEELPRAEEAPSPAEPAPAELPRIVFTTRSKNDLLYRLSGELLGPDGDGYPRHRFTGTDCLAYFRTLADLEVDWVINLDEDAFVLDRGRLLALVGYLEAHGHAACGMPDGGVVPIRRHNPAACHAAFTVFDLRRVRAAWRDWESVVAAGPRPEHENAVAPFARRGAAAFDHDKPYYGVFFALLNAGESILYLNAEPWRDGISTLIKDPDGVPLVLHTGFSRAWSHSYHTRRRILDALEYVRQVRGLRPAGLDPAAPQLPGPALLDGPVSSSQAPITLAGDVNRALTSIVIVTHNELPYTRRCVDSIRRGTDEPHELIFVDNGSTDGTTEYLHALPGATVIVNSTNRGFPAAANQGLRAARGGQVLLLNNDTVVPAGWLRRLLAPLAEDPRIGLVGPCSNAVSGPQQVPSTYHHLDELDAFAQEWAAAHAGERAEIGRLVGFCLLIRRELLDQIGYLDERFGVGCFEDDDYCRRAIQAGYRAVIARDAFLHHFGSQTFRGSGQDLGAILRHNEELFRAKWASTALAQRPAAQARPPAGKDIRLSLCMIVRDNAPVLTACLNSIRPWVDEMVVVDTGSRDETPKLAERLGARVFHFPWCDDFSAARNESLRHARGHWLFWMDSDDVIDEDNGRKLRALACQDDDPAILGFVMQVHCPGPGADGALHTTVVDHVKLLRNVPGIAFEGRIHEQVLTSIRRLGGEVGWTDIFVVHAGYDHSPEGQARKRERDLRLLHQEHQERGDHPFTLFNLGMTYADLGRSVEAIEYLRRSIARATPGESHLRKAYALLVACHQQAGDRQAAWNACQEGLMRTPGDPELRFRAALLLHESGRLREAAQTYEELLAALPERHFSSMDRGITGYKARQNLAIVYQDLSDWRRATEQWRRVVSDRPDYRAGWRGLVEALLHQGQCPEAEVVLEQLSDGGPVGAEKWLLRGQVAAARGDLGAARNAFEQAVANHAEDEAARQALCHFLFDHGRPEEIEQALQELLRRQPGDASAHHNLGTVYLRLGRPQAAAEAYRRSLRLRPNAAATAQLLELAMQQASAMDLARRN